MVVLIITRIQYKKVVTHEGDTIEYEHTSHKAMKDYTSYMLAEILKRLHLKHMVRLMDMVCQA